MSASSDDVSTFTTDDIVKDHGELWTLIVVGSMVYPQVKPPSTKKVDVAMSMSNVHSATIGRQKSVWSLSKAQAGVPCLHRF